MTDDVTSDLSHIPGTLVIARRSAYRYQGKAVDVRTVGEELGVRYALEGSVRRLGDTLRVNAQLVDTENGAHLWADRFDQPIANMNTGQEDIVRRIGQTLNVALTDVESARSWRERPTKADAFDLILRGRALQVHPMGKQEHAERTALLEEAVRLDPLSAYAKEELATELIRVSTYEDRDEFDRAAQLLRDAVVISPNDPLVLEANAYFLSANGHCKESLVAYERLVSEMPNAASPFNPYMDMAVCLIFTGRAEEAIPVLEKSIRLNPRSPNIVSRYKLLGFAMLLVGRDEDAIIWTERALSNLPPGYPELRAQFTLRLAASRARLGHFDEARRLLAEANRVWPYDTARAHYPDELTSPVYAAQIERFQAALRLAGDRDRAEEEADFGVAPDTALHETLAGPTPTTAPGAVTIRTAELARLLAGSKPIVIDPLLYSWGRSIPGAVGLEHAGFGGSMADARQNRLAAKMQALTGGYHAAPIVAVGFNSERFDGHNLALRLVALGYTSVYWYRGGREAWEAAGLPEAPIEAESW